MLHHLVQLMPLVVLVGLTAMVRRYPALGWLVLAALVISAADWTNPGALAHLGGLAVYPQDVLALVFLLAVLTTPGAFRHLETADVVIWGVVVALVALSLLRGFSTFGLAGAGNEARGLIQLVACTLWAWSRIPRPEFRRELSLWCWVTGLGLTVVAFVHIHERGLGSVDQRILVDGDLVTTRPLVATQALVLGLIGLALLTRGSRATVKLVALGFLALAVVCQHRSVWAALAVAGASLVIFAPKVRTRLFGLGFLAAFVVLVLYAAGTLDPMIAKLQLALHSRGTFVDRQQTWRALVDEQDRQGASTVLVGQPFGTGFARIEPNVGLVTYAPHNWYVSTYLRIGLLGAATLVLALVRGLWRNLRFRQPVGVAWGAALMTYCYAYNLQLYVAPVLAVALGVQMAGVLPGRVADAELEDHASEDAPAGWVQAR